MSSIGPNYAQHQGVSAVSGSWATVTNAEGSGTATYATWTSTTSGGTATLELMAYNVNVPAGMVLDSVFVECQHHESSTTIISGLTGQLFTTTNGADAATSDFETGLGFWNNVSGTLTQDATNVNSGTTAGKLVGTAMSTTAGSPEGAIPCTASQQLNAGIWVYTTAASQTAHLDILNFYNAAGTGLTTLTSGTSTALTQNAWTFVQVGHAAPATAVTCNVSLTFGASGTFWVDTFSAGTPAAVGSPTTFTRATSNRIDSITATTGVNVGDVGNLRLRVVATHNATTSSGVESIDFARITANYHMPVAVLPGNEFGESDQSVEFGTLNWVAGTNTTVALSQTQAYDGQQSVQATSTASGDMSVLWNGAKEAVTAGNNYAFACRVWSPVTTVCNLEIDFYNGGTFVGYTDLTVSPGTKTALASGWNYVIVQGPATATATGAVPIVIPTSTGAGQAFYVDQFFFGPAPVSDSDTGSGTEAAPTVAATLADTDAGSGTEGTPSVTATLADSDTGSGADGGEAVAATLADADAGSGTEGAPTVAAALSDSDASGAGADTESVAVLGTSVSDSDTGSGVEGTEGLAATLADAETSAGADTETTAATLADGDTAGAGVDTEIVGVATAGTPDTGAGADTESVLVTGNVASDLDVGTGTEGAPTVAATLAVSDTGSGLDAESVAVMVSSSDASGAAVETGSQADATTAINVLQIVDATASNVFGILQCDISTADDSTLIVVCAANVNDQSWSFSQVWDARGNMWKEAISTVASDWAQNATYETPPYPALAIWYAPYALGVDSVSVAMANLTSEVVMAMRVYEVTGIRNTSTVSVSAASGNLLPTAVGISAGITTTETSTFLVSGMAVAEHRAVTFDTGSSNPHYTGTSVLSLAGTTGAYNDSLTFDSCHAQAATTGTYSCLWDNVSTDAWVGAAVSFGNGPADTSNANPYWPQVLTRIAFGEVPNDPQLGSIDYKSATSADVSLQVLGESVAYGIPYELGTPQAGEAQLTLYNQDGQFDPLNDASPHSPYVLDFTPFRQHALWSGRDYGVFTGYIEQWPQVWDSSLMNTANTEGIDAIGALARTKLKSAMQHEVLYDMPWGYWPLADSANSAYATNIGSGPGAYNTMAPFPPRTGGVGAAGFGVGTSLAGDTATGWGQTNDTPNNDQGWDLVMTTQDPVDGEQIVPDDMSGLEGSGTLPWATQGITSATLARSTAQHHSGTHSLSVTMISGTGANIVGTAPVIAQRGQYYVATAWFRAPVAGCTGRITITFVDDHGNEYDQTASPDTAITNGAWSSVSYRFFMPSTATNVYSFTYALLMLGPVSTGNVFYVDDVTCTQQSGVMPSANIYPGAITAEAWAMFDSIPGKNSPSAILTLTDSAGVYLATLQIAQQLPGLNATYAVLELTVLNSSLLYEITPSSANARGFADSRWHHYVMTMTSAGSTVWVDGIEYISTSTIPANTDPETLMVGGIQSNKHDPFNIGIGNYAHVALYAGELAPVRINNHFRSGHDAFPEDTGSRINRLLGYVGYSGPRALDIGSSVLAGCYSIVGQFGSDALTDCLTWEYGMGWTSGLGAVRFQNRINRFTGSTLGVFGDADGEWHYSGDGTYPDDPTYQYNDIEISREGPTLSQGVTFFSGDPQNTVPQYFTSTLQQTLALLSDEAIQDRVAFLYALLHVSVVRADTLVITPSADPNLWGVALGAQVGGRYTIRRRPMRPGQPVLEFDVIISSISHVVSPGSWVTTFTTLPAVLPGTTADGIAWRLDDPVASVLGTSTRPGW